MATGQIQGSIGDTRIEQDFTSFLEALLASAPAQTRWHIVCDNLNTHVSQGVVRLVARHCSLTGPLGEKGQSGVVEVDRHPLRPSRGIEATASPFISRPSMPRWMNQIEIWFSILVRKLIRRANFTSKHDLKAKILRFIAYFNETLAKPFRWTYVGKPLTV